jgi:hypothetical protein
MLDIIENNKYQAGGFFMATRDLNLEREWKIKFEGYKNSGLSVKAWCEKNGIKATTFHYVCSNLKVYHECS